MYFVIQKKHNKAGSWDNNVHVKDTLDAAMHQYHAFLSTYGYGQNDNLDYVACEVETEDGRCIKNEIDDRIDKTNELEVE